MRWTQPVDLLYLAYNRLEFTRETFQTLLENTDWSYVRELVVYDDGSTDGTYEWLQGKIAEVPVPVRLERTDLKAPVASMLRFIDASETSIVVKTDSDAMLPPAWLRLSLEVFVLHPELDFLGIEAMNPHSDDTALPRSYQPSPFVSGLALYRRSCFAGSRPVPFDKYYGLEEWQMGQGDELARGWISPALPVFLLDRFPFDPWSSYSARYVRNGWQRPWARYDRGCALWRWRWPLGPPFGPLEERRATIIDRDALRPLDTRGSQTKWPWDESSQQHVVLRDVLERLPDKVQSMNELWRVLQPGGTAHVVVRTTDGASAVSDPGLFSSWNRRSFLYFETGSLYRERHASALGIRASFQVLEERIEHNPDGSALSLTLRAVKPSGWTVVILSANASNLVECVTTLLTQEPDLTAERIVVVDDGARAQAEPRLPRVVWVAGARPFNQARNLNLGLAAAPGDVIIMHDDARLLTASGFRRLSEEVSKRPGVGICSAGVRGAVGNPRQAPIRPSAFREEPKSLAFVCAFVARTVVEQIGRFDEDLAGYGFIDDDYCARALAAGYRLGVWDGCIVDHSGALPSTFRSRPDFWGLFDLNRTQYRAKWGSRA